MKWEYYIFDIDDLKLPILNRVDRIQQLTQHVNWLGQQGWESAGAVDAGNNKILMFKRAIKNKTV